MYPYLSVHYDRAMGYAIIPNRNLLSLQELAKMQSSSLQVILNEDLFSYHKAFLWSLNLKFKFELNIYPYLSVQN